MPRANRHFIPGFVWHITHRCHKEDFLFKFSRDRRRWLQWLFEAKKRYGLCVLNYMVTSNHIHLLVRDDGGKDVIPRSIQLIASRTAEDRICRGDEYFIPKNVPHAGEFKAGTRTIHCFGGKRAERALPGIQPDAEQLAPFFPEL